MKFLELEIFNDFECVGSECPYTCCAGGWRIVVDSETAEYYKTVTGDFGKRLTECVKVADGHSRFTLTDDGRCSFLNKKNLCDIYINLGPEHLCYTCKTYPRYSFVVGDILFSGVTISCPEVAKLFLEHKEPLQIDFAENDMEPVIDPKFDWNVFNYSIRALTAAVGVAQNRALTISERLAVLTLFMFQFQVHIDEKRDPSGVIELFSNPDYYSKVLPDTGIYQRDLKSKATFISRSMGYYCGLRQFESSLPELSELINNLFKDDSGTFPEDKWNQAYDILKDEKEQLWMEQALIYALFRYFMQGFKKRDFYTKFIMGVVLFCELSITTEVLHYLRWEKKPEPQELIMIVAHSSRVIEHDNNFRDKAIEHFKEQGMTDPVFLLKLFS